VAYERNQQLEENSLQHAIACMKETKDNSVVVNHNEIIVVRCSIMFQQQSRLDIEIEVIRMLMVNISQRRHAEKIYNNSSRRQVRKVECKSKASGALQSKVWKLGRLRISMKKRCFKTNGQPHYEFWDPEGPQP
jgi:hypothetical protein